MALFTVIAELKGGTYVAQENAKDPKDALLNWVNRSTAMPKFSARNRKLLSDWFAEFGPTPIEGTKNVWCASASLDGMLLVQIVKTAR